MVSPSFEPGRRNRSRCNAKFPLASSVSIVGMGMCHGVLAKFFFPPLLGFSSSVPSLTLPVRSLVLLVRGA